MDENIEQKIDALHEEKKEFVEETFGKPEELTDEEEYEYEEVEEDVETEETEFSLTGDEIESWIIELTKLKEEKTPIELEVDEETNLKINYEEDSVEEGG